MQSLCNPQAPCQFQAGANMTVLMQSLCNLYAILSNPCASCHCRAGSNIAKLLVHRCDRPNGVSESRWKASPDRPQSSLSTCGSAQAAALTVSGSQNACCATALCAAEGASVTESPAKSERNHSGGKRLQCVELAEEHLDQEQPMERCNA